MINNKTKKLVILISIVSIILSFCFVLKNINHECNHDDCPICEVINIVKKDLKGFKPILKIVLIEIIINNVLVHIQELFLIRKNNTLIGLKVELIN